MPRPAVPQPGGLPEGDRGAQLGPFPCVPFLPQPLAPPCIPQQVAELGPCHPELHASWLGRSAQLPPHSGALPSVCCAHIPFFPPSWPACSPPLLCKAAFCPAPTLQQPLPHLTPSCWPQCPSFHLPVPALPSHTETVPMALSAHHDRTPLWSVLPHGSPLVLGSSTREGEGLRALEGRAQEWG